MVDENETLKAAYETARAAFEVSRTAENMATVKAAWAAYDASAPKRKVSGFASRAGKRRHAEMMANLRRRR